MPALVAVDVILVALVAAIFAFAAAALLRPVIAGTMAVLPGVGAWVGARIDQLVLNVVTYTAPWIHTATVPLVWLLRALVGQSDAHTGAVGEVVDATRGALWTIVHVSIPQSAADTRTYAYGQAAYAAALASWAYSAASSYAGSLFAAESAYVQAQAAQSAAVAAQLFSEQIAYAQALSAQNQAFAQALAAIGVGYTQAVEARAAQNTAAALAAAEGFTIGVDRALREFVGIEAGILQGYAEALFGRSIDYTRDSNAVTASNAATAIAVVAVAVTAIQESACMRQCAQLGAFGSLLGGLELAGLLAVVAAAVQDPPATALHWVEDVAGEAVAIGRGVAQTVGVNL